MQPIPLRFVTLSEAIPFTTLDFAAWQNLEAADVVSPMSFPAAMSGNLRFEVGDLLRVVCTDGVFWATVWEIAEVDGVRMMTIKPDLAFSADASRRQSNTSRQKGEN